MILQKIYARKYLFLSFALFILFSLFFSVGTRFENGIYLDYSKSFVTDYEFSVINQYSNFEINQLVTKTYNFPDFHGEGPSIAYVPFLFILKLASPSLQYNHVDLIAILINGLFFFLRERI